MSDRVEAVFFDWNKTSSRSLFWEHLAESDPQTYKNIQKTLFTDNSQLIIPWMRGEYQSEDIAQIVARHTGVPYKKVIDDLVISCQQMRFVLPDYPQLINGLRRSNIITAIASDNMDTFDRWTVPALGLNNLFDLIVNSHSRKALKDDFRSDGSNIFFEEFFQNTGISPRHTILLDDSAKTGEGVKKIGINFRQINSPLDLKKAVGEIINLNY